MEYINSATKFWKHSYRVHLSEFDINGVIVNANNEQEALDYAVDHAEQKGWLGLFIENPTEEDFETRTVCGNHCLVLSSDNVIVTKID